MTAVAASRPALPSTSRPAPHRTNAVSQWLPPIGLIVLSLIPVIAGAARLSELLGGPEITANNARFVTSPIPVTVHIVSVTLYSLLGALQFVPSLRRGRPNWHRVAGRILVPAGVLVAISGLWMSAFYPRPAGDGESLVVVRLIVGSAMLASIVLAVFAIRRRDFASHGAWMTRAYAIALGAGTQVFTILPWVVIFGPIGAADELPRTVLMTAGWVINLGVAEYVIRRRRGQRSHRTSAGVGRSVSADAQSANGRITADTLASPSPRQTLATPSSVQMIDVHDAAPLDVQTGVGCVAGSRPTARNVPGPPRPTASR
jgi:uncharacterized membrane protein